MPDPYSGDSDPNWTTPRHVLDVIESFHPIDLDPCSNEWSKVNAVKKVSPPENGLATPWHAYDHTFVNPPYSKGEIAKWTEKARYSHNAGSKHITMLINVCPETEAWRKYVWPTATRVAFWRRRIKFDKPGGGTGTKLPSAVIYWGSDGRRFDRVFSPHSTVMRDWL